MNKNSHLGGEDVTQLGTETISSSGNLVLLIIEVGASEQVAKDHSWHIPG